MKVMVCTKQGQGKRKSDFSWTEEGELAYFGFTCDGEKLDGGCGCERSFCGMDSGKAGTTAKIVDSPMTIAEFIKKRTASDKAAGWNQKAADIKEECIELLRIANVFPVGAVIEKRGDKIQIRKL